MSVTKISEKNKIVLWGKAAGRCQYKGCNNPLYRDQVTKREFNQAYIAHIVADEPKGPRGDSKRSKLLANDLSNLMLLCDKHHRLIDKEDVAGHPESLLITMKKEHEERMERVTDIVPNLESYIVIYKANIGIHTPEISFDTARGYISPFHPAKPYAVELYVTNSSTKDDKPSFWKTEEDNLLVHFEEQLRRGLRKNEIKHISLFAFAPIPLLIRLGTLVNDISTIEVHQPVREPQTWNLSDESYNVDYRITAPETDSSKVALNISLSGNVLNNNIHAVLGDDCSIYTLTIDEPYNDFLKTKAQLQDFRIAMRKLFNKIKTRHGSDTPLHVFPAMPVATSIELGRVWLPKADMPLIIYDYNSAHNSFAKAIEIRNDKKEDQTPA